MTDKLIVCGRVLGTSHGWDVADELTQVYYAFQPAAEYKGPVANSICVDFAKGTIATYREDGELLEEKDLIDSIADCVRERSP